MSLRINLLSAVSVLAWAIAPTGTYAADTTDLPAALLCSVSDHTTFIYLSRIEPDGSAEYSGLNGGVAMVDAAGVVEPAETMIQGDCVGKTIQELRVAGKTRDFASQ